MSEERLLTIDEMLAAEDVSYVTVPVPEWSSNGVSGSVRFGSIDAGTMIEFAEFSSSPDGDQNATIRLIIQSLVDADGKRLVQKEHVVNYIPLFMKKGVRVMNRLLDAVMALNDIKIGRVQIKNALSEAAIGSSPTE